MHGGAIASLGFSGRGGRSFEVRSLTRGGTRFACTIRGRWDILLELKVRAGLAIGGAYKRRMPGSAIASLGFSLYSAFASVWPFPLFFSLGSLS